MARNIPHLNFGLPEEVEEMREMVARWVDDRLSPRAAGSTPGMSSRATSGPSLARSAFSA